MRLLTRGRLCAVRVAGGRVLQVVLQEPTMQVLADPRKQLHLAQWLRAHKQGLGRLPPYARGRAATIAGALTPTGADAAEAVAAAVAARGAAARLQAQPRLLPRG